MKEKDLHEKFISHLCSLYTSKKELTYVLEDILKIERESISRRLNGKVLFTVREIGKIAEKLDISLDCLLKEGMQFVNLPINLIMPSSMESNDLLLKIIEENQKRLSDMRKIASFHIGRVFDSLPTEFFIPYENLCKFIYFKWMYYFLKDKFSINYDTWQPPKQLDSYHEELMNIWESSRSIFYIWNNPVIWNLVKEIDFLYKMRILSDESKDLIKRDLHGFLTNAEIRTSTAREDSVSLGKSIDMYISSINIGFSCTYFQSEPESFIYYRTPFSYTHIYRDAKTFDIVCEWLNSMKKVSTLISGSGAIERRSFFNEQHKIVDLL